MYSGDESQIHYTIIYMLHIQSYTAKSHIWLARKQLCLWSTSAGIMLVPTASFARRFASSTMKK